MDPFEHCAGIYFRLALLCAALGFFYMATCDPNWGDSTLWGLLWR